MITFYLALFYKDMATLISHKIRTVFNYFLTEFFLTWRFAASINHNNFVLTDTDFFNIIIH